MDNSTLLSLVGGLVSEASGYDDEVARMFEQSLDYYFMRAHGDEVDGRSKVVTGNYSAMVEANLAQMSDAFSSDRLVEFEARGADDEDQAQLESDVVSTYIMDRNPGFITLTSAIKNALMMRNGIVKATVEERPITRTKTYDEVEPEAYGELTNRADFQIDVLEYKPEEKTLKLRETKRNRKFLFENVAPENFLYTKNWHKPELWDIPLAGEVHHDLRSDLVQKFPDKKEFIDALPMHQGDSGTNASRHRNPRGSTELRGQTSDSSLDIIEWFEVYVLVDRDGDGIAERNKVCFVENKGILEAVEYPFVCYAGGQVLINPGRWQGVSIFDKLKQNEDITTGLTRALLDNSNVSNKRRLAYLDGKVNADDLSSGLVDGDVRIRNVADVRQALMSIDQPDISAGILLNIQHQSVVRAELGGAALDLSTAQAQLSDRVGSEGVDRMYSVMEQLAALMTKTIAESLIRNAWRLAHRVLRYYMDEPVELRVSGNWQSMVPSEWFERDDLTVKPGMSAGERRRKRDSLQFIIESMIGFSERGLNDILVNIKGFHKALLDWGRVAEVDNPEQYWLDPDSDASKEALQQRENTAKEERAAQRKLMDVALGMEQLRISLDKRNADADRVVEVLKAILDSETKEASIVGKATSDLQLAQESARSDAEVMDKKTDGIKSIEKLLSKLEAVSAEPDGD